MDSITQATLGAAVGEAILGKRIGWKGAALGAIVGTIPDLDIVLMPFFNEFQKLGVHRGYSHSLIFCFLASFIIAYLLNRTKWCQTISYKKLWSFAFLCLLTHVLLDAFTTYGTQLFLPFNRWRVSFDSINIVDPFYTVPLLAGLLISLILYRITDRHRSTPNNIGLMLSSLYLIFTLGNKQHIEHEISTQLAEQNISFHHLLSVPVGIGNVNWYGVTKDKTHLHLGKYSMLKQNKIDFHSFPINDDLLKSVDPELVDRLDWFSQGFYTVAEKDGKIRVYNMQCDMQGVRTYGDYRAPTAFYFEIEPSADGTYTLSTGMHAKE